MTFVTLQNRILNRLNLTTTTARSRIKDFINERYRAVATSVGLVSRVRFGTVTFPTVNGQYEYQLAAAILTPNNVGDVIHAQTLTYVAGNRILLESTLDSLRVTDPGNLRTGFPVRWAQHKYQRSGGVTTTNVAQVYMWPKPDAVYTIQVDGILSGVDLSNDTDVPVLPDDFHDVLELFATADELYKESHADQAKIFEQKAEARLRELRYFIEKSVYCGLQQGEHGAWWWGYWWGSYRG